MNTTNKVQVENSTTTTTTSTGTSTTYQCPYIKPKAEQGWECPRCGHINAPWVRQCDCTRGAYDYDKWTITPTWTDGEWWKTYVTCGQADDITKNPNVYQVGGSDYKVNGTYVNVGGTQSNKVDPNATAWNCTNPNNCHTPHYNTETMVDNCIHDYCNLKTSKETK